MNELSSRSHAVFIIIAENSVIKDVDQTEDKVADQEAGKTRQSFKVGNAEENERFNSTGLLFAEPEPCSFHRSSQRQQSASPDAYQKQIFQEGGNSYLSAFLPVIAAA
jgi:hypothetical protein